MCVWVGGCGYVCVCVCGCGCVSVCVGVARGEEREMNNVINRNIN